MKLVRRSARSPHLEARTQSHENQEMKVSMPNLHTSTALAQPECRIFQEKHERLPAHGLSELLKKHPGSSPATILLLSIFI